MEQEKVSNGDSTPSVTYHTEYASTSERRVDEWKTNDITKLIISLCKFQGLAGSVKQGKTNPFFHSKYADINDILKAVLPLLSECGLAVTQGNRWCKETNGFFVTTMLCHISGQWLKSEVRIPIGGKKDAHAIGGACTYGRRYGLSAILGISVEADDDGNSNVK